MKVFLPETGLELDVSDDYLVPHSSTRYPSKYKKLTSYTLNWRTRCTFESYVRPTMFVTFTYNNENYIEHRLLNVDDDRYYFDKFDHSWKCVTKEREPIRETLKDDWQKFMKRFRGNLKRQLFDDIKFSYYVISERGDDGRLHFHALIFGLPFESYKSRNQEGKLVDMVKFNKYTQCITDSWNNGFVFFEAACPANIKYVTKYLHKRMISSDYISLKSQGLGLAYFNEARQQYIHDNKLTKIHIGKRIFFLPRYIKKKIFTPDELKEVNEMIEQEKLCKIINDEPANFNENRHYAYYPDCELQFKDLKDWIIEYDDKSDRMLCYSVQSYVDWYYLRQRYYENLKYKSVFTKRL